MTRLRLALVVPLAVALAACGSDEPAEPGGLTVGEAQELNAAAEMLDADAVTLNDVAPAENGS